MINVLYALTNNMLVVAATFLLILVFLGSKKLLCSNMLSENKPNPIKFARLAKELAVIDKKENVILRKP